MYDDLPSSSSPSTPSIATHIIVIYYQNTSFEQQEIMVIVLAIGMTTRLLI